MNDLTTEKGRREAVKVIEDSFLSTLRDNGFELSPTAACSVMGDRVELGIAVEGGSVEYGPKMAFASELGLYAVVPDDFYGRKENEISFESCGNFTPDLKRAYWRTIHAASILKNWKLVCGIVNTHCEMYRDLQKKVSELKINP